MTESRKKVILCLHIVLIGGFSASIHAQVQVNDTQARPRKAKNLVKPEYSPLARRMNLCGTAKIEVIIAPSGKVKTTRIVGGHPLLAVEAEKAARGSEFEAGPTETTQIIEFKFGAN